jgi:hypothetical protein
MKTIKVKISTSNTQEHSASRQVDQRPTRVQLPISEVHDLPRKGRTQGPHAYGAPSSPRRRLREQPQITNRFPFKPQRKIGTNS